jgi:uncharacterized protein YqiB (DUF1249 family)
MINQQEPEHKLPKKPHYKVNLREQMACCEANYVRLLKLMPNLLARRDWNYELEAGKGTIELHLEVTEQAPYTTMLNMTQTGLAVGSVDVTPVLYVRMYHDVKMAEVISWRGHRSIKPRYSYPNKHMYQQDEKAQFNKYLADSLDFALQHGLATDVVTIKT